MGALCGVLDRVAAQDFAGSLPSAVQQRNVEEFERIVIRAGGGAQIVYLSDIARVELGAQYYAASGLYQAVPATVIGIYQAPGGLTHGDS